MFSNYISKLFLSFLVSASLFAETQVIGISAFGDISSEPEEVINTIVQNSLATALKKENRFSVVLVSNTVTTLSSARETAINNKLDIILYGTYRKEGREFVILIKIYDILENEVRLSRLYRGEYSRNIFDTVDAVATSASEEISRVLPALLTEEDILRAQEKRR